MAASSMSRERAPGRWSPAPFLEGRITSSPMRGTDACRRALLQRVNWAGLRAGDKPATRPQTVREVGLLRLDQARVTGWVARSRPVRRTRRNRRTCDECGDDKIARALQEELDDGSRLSVAREIVGLQLETAPSVMETLGAVAGIVSVERARARLGRRPVAASRGVHFSSFPFFVG